MDKLEIGTRIRIIEGQAPYFKAGDEGVLSHFDGRDWWADMDEKYGDGNWCVGHEEGVAFEVVGTDALTHAEYFHKYGKLTEERIRDLLAVYEEAKGVEVRKARAAKDLLRRVREIDEAAAEYLVEHSCVATSLVAAFTWAVSPQGDTYWRNIARQLGEVS